MGKSGYLALNGLGSVDNMQSRRRMGVHYLEHS